LPHAKILRIDTSKAKAHSGVLAVVTADDVPNVLTGRHLQDTPVLARERVRFIGEKIAVTVLRLVRLRSKPLPLSRLITKISGQSLIPWRRCKKELLCSILT
jgi:hypothetical protein